MRIALYMLSLSAALVVSTEGLCQEGKETVQGASDKAQTLFNGGFQQPMMTRPDTAALLVQPVYPGGIAAMNEYLRSAIIYPEDEFRVGKQGVVYVSFLVIEDGAVRNITVKKGVSPGLDAEALRAVASMPRWSPGTLDGRPVKTRFTIPISFMLAGPISHQDQLDPIAPAVPKSP
ncbi:MAG: energy transducer TonB [Flavobacteriales bacterium]